MHSRAAKPRYATFSRQESFGSVGNGKFMQFTHNLVHCVSNPTVDGNDTRTVHVNPEISRRICDLNLLYCWYSRNQTSITLSSDNSGET